jgi:putative DNA methylase
LTNRRKIIEVALPLSRINEAAFREKNRKVGKPQNLHHWWSRKPITSSRALLAAQLIDDPASHPETFQTTDQVETERKRLHDLIAALGDWESMNDTRLLRNVREEILKSCGDELPRVVDPFVGGGSLLLAAEQLGIPSAGSDLNPLAVVLAKALLEVPPLFQDANPVSPGLKNSQLHWNDLQGLVGDIRVYSSRIFSRSSEILRPLYPPSVASNGEEAPTIAHVWVRTVTCPNPACRVKAPLASTWILSKKRGTYIHPTMAERPHSGTISFDIVSTSNLDDIPPGTVDRNGARCVVCNSSIDFDYIRKEGVGKRIGAQMVAAVSANRSGRSYRSPTAEQIAAADQTRTLDAPDQRLPAQALSFRVQGYGLEYWSEMFTARQLFALTIFSDQISEIRGEIFEDATAAGMSAGEPMEHGGTGASAYADAVVLYLTLILSRMTDWNNSFAPWDSVGEVSQHLFTGQSIPMCWNFSEANPLGPGSSGSWQACTKSITQPLLDRRDGSRCEVNLADAREMSFADSVITTDPPYFDNIGYSDLSDFFYVWQRRSLRSIFPSIFKTILVPKTGELVANQFRAGSSEAAAEEFEKGFVEIFERMRSEASHSYPVVIYFASRQNERVRRGETSTSWSTILSALVDAGWHLVRTWPLRAENASRTVAQGSNAMAAAVVLVARPRSSSATATDRRGFLHALKSELPESINQLIRGGISPVDLPQAAAGPGISIYSQFSRVVEANGEPMRVKTALALISTALDEIITDYEGEFDSSTSFALQWFKAYGYNAGQFGDADSQASGRGVSVSEIARSRVLLSRANSVRLLRPVEYDDECRAAYSIMPTIWSALHMLLAELEKGGVAAAGAFLRWLREEPSFEDAASLLDLAHLLYRIAEENKATKDAISLNSLVTVWPDILDAARSGAGSQEQGSLDFGTEE